MSAPVASHHDRLSPRNTPENIGICTVTVSCLGLLLRKICCQGNLCRTLRRHRHNQVVIFVLLFVRVGSAVPTNQFEPRSRLPPSCYRHAKCLGIVLAYGAGPGVRCTGLTVGDVPRTAGYGVVYSCVFFVRR